MFPWKFDSPQVKRDLIFSTIKFLCKLSHELPNALISNIHTDFNSLCKISSIHTDFSPLCKILNSHTDFNPLCKILNIHNKNRAICRKEMRV